MSEKAESSSKFRFLISRTVIIILVFLGGFLLWASLAPLTTGAVAPGTVTVSSYRKVVQHQYGGSVKEILVKEGQKVKVGQLLVKLDDATARSQLAQIRSEYFQAMVAKYRLNGERSFVTTIHYPPEIVKMGKDPEFARYMLLQEQLFQARKQRIDSEKRGLQDVIASMQVTRDKLLEQKRSIEKQQGIYKKQVDSLKDITDQGYYAKNRYLDMQRILEEINGRNLEIDASLVRLDSSVKEYTLRLRTVETDYVRQVETDLNDIDKKATALKDQYTAALNILEKTEVKAPDNGMVMGMKIHTIGGVISPGQPLMEIVPENAELIIEGKVNPNDIEGITLDTKVDLRFTALNPKKTPVFEGTIRYLSPDIHFDEQSKMSYYVVKAAIDESSIKALSSIHQDIKPGMPAQVVLKRGKRTFLGYFLKVFIDRLSIAFTR
jgi:HlyD family type I secretion membrane fusion protein